MMEQIPVGRFGFLKKESIEWVKSHLTVVTTSVVIVLMGLITASRWFKSDVQVDYLAAEMAYHQWKGAPGEYFTKLQKILTKHPELHAKYDGGIAQKLLSSSQSGLAMGYGQAALKRMAGFSPYYTEFSKASLLIAEKKLTEALESAKRLKLSMEKDESFWEKKSEIIRHGCILYAYNLLRIAMLEKAAGTAQGELAAWQELKKNAGWQGTEPASKTYDPEAYSLIQDNFRDQEISLLDYIKFREEFLENRHE